MVLTVNIASLINSGYLCMKRISFLILFLALGGCSALHKQNVYKPLATKHIYLDLYGNDRSLIYQEVVLGLREKGFTVDTNYETTPAKTMARYGVLFDYGWSSRHYGQFNSIGKVYDYGSPESYVVAEYSYRTDKATMTPVYESGRGRKVVNLISSMWNQSD